RWARRKPPVECGAAAGQRSTGDLAAPGLSIPSGPALPHMGKLRKYRSTISAKRSSNFANTEHNKRKAQFTIFPLFARSCVDCRRGGCMSFRSVLIVDDNEAIRRRLTDEFAKSQLETRQADGFESALALVRGEPVDLAVVDLMMPGPSGLDLLEVLRREELA